MYGQLIRGLTALGALAVVWLDPNTALSAQAIENKNEICLQQTRYQEQNHGIPQHLLTSISLVESGRWDKISKAKIAWPWTVTSGANGRFFDSKEEAMAEVEIMMTEGVRNIDVGCMQINLHYHADAFDTLSDAFDPKQNAAYAAKFLKKLKKPSNSWLDAAGTYHSSTPDKKAYYLGKVTAHWNAERGLKSVASAPAKPLTKVASASSRQIDYARMNSLNAAFKKRVNADPVAKSKSGRVKQLSAARQREMQDWQNARSTGQNMTHLLAMRRAQQSLRQRKKFAAMGKSKFPEMRRNQLKKWREKGIWYGG
jgi:hypothetical protein